MAKKKKDRYPPTHTHKKKTIIIVIKLLGVIIQTMLTRIGNVFKK